MVRVIALAQAHAISSITLFHPCRSSADRFLRPNKLPAPKMRAGDRASAKNGQALMRRTNHVECGSIYIAQPTQTEELGEASHAGG